MDLTKVPMWTFTDDILPVLVVSFIVVLIGHSIVSRRSSRKGA